MPILTASRSIIELPPSLARRFTATRRLLDTSLSEVFEARTADGTQCLVKRIKHKKGYRPEAVEEVRRAYRSSRVADRAAIPSLVVEDATSYYEVLPHFEGWTVHQVMNLRRQVGVTGKLLEDWMRDLLQLVVPLHEAGLVHRDINPDNVLISSRDLSLVLLDFSGVVSANATQGIHALFAPGFSAPEQLRLDIGTYNDVYSLGAMVLYLNRAELPPNHEEMRYRNPDLTLKGRVYYCSSTPSTDTRRLWMCLRRPGDTVRPKPCFGRDGTSSASRWRITAGTGTGGPRRRSSSVHLAPISVD